MPLEIELFGVLGKDRERVQTFQVDDPLTVREAAALAGVAADEIGMAVVDGVQVPIDETISRSCRLSLFSHMMGG